MPGETESEMVRRHVRQGVAILARQRGVIARLERCGRDTAEAQTLLIIFEEMQAAHLQHLERLPRGAS